MQVWSLDIPSTGEAVTVTNFDVWAVNNILRLRAGSNYLVFHLSAIPTSETRLRDEGIIPLYSFWRELSSIIRSSARELGAAVPDIPEAPRDWNEEASTDSNALAAEILPHLAEPARQIVDWILSSRGRDPRLHWTSRLAVTSLVPGLILRAALAIGGTEDSVLGPYVARATSDEFKRIAGVINEELLRIRAQPGSGWNEEEARRVVDGQFGNLKGMTKAGT